ncbi:MAG: hypothetical protein JXX29_02875 [Deltaproteobacteria bacterium]|nr:hypothetical protein [Deltaproteobacteria bacterium]MBN2670586.1 hypothetical protein [Deltaproteobacteria bacterium]
MASAKFFFLGFEVDDDLQQRLSNCSKSDKSFLEQPQYLEQFDVAGKRYLGRRLDGDGISESSVEDSARNVASLIKRVAPGWKKAPFHAVLTAVEEEITHSDVVVSF